MDTRSRFQIDDEVLNTLADRIKGEILVGFPVEVMEDSDGHTSHIQPLIKFVQRMPDGSQQVKDYPPIYDAPNNFPSGGGSTLTMPVKKKDTGYAFVMSRSIDAWHEKDGMQPQIDARMHDLSDAIYVPGLRATPRKLKNVSTESAQLRSDDGKHIFDMHPKNGPSMSADEGKHLFSLDPQKGATLKTAMKLAVDASQGMDVKGATHFMDAVTSAKSFNAPGGSLGGGLGGLLSSLVGALIGAGAMVALQAAQTPSAAPQAASFTQAALAR